MGWWSDTKTAVHDYFGESDSEKDTRLAAEAEQRGAEATLGEMGDKYRGLGARYAELANTKKRTGPSEAERAVRGQASRDMAMEQAQVKGSGLSPGLARALSNRAGTQRGGEMYGRLGALRAREDVTEQARVDALKREGRMGEAAMMAREEAINKMKYNLATGKVDASQAIIDKKSGRLHKAGELVARAGAAYMTGGASEAMLAGNYTGQGGGGGGTSGLSSALQSGGALDQSMQLQLGGGGGGGFNYNTGGGGGGSPGRGVFADRSQYANNGLSDAWRNKTYDDAFPLGDFTLSSQQWPRKP
jgi:hypothetical protein